MQDYDIKKGHFEEIEGEKLGSLVAEIFGKSEASPDGGFQTTFGALAKLKVSIKDKKTLTIDTVMDPKVAPNVAAETVKKYNSFMERATGFTSKERVKRVQKKAKEGKL